MMEWTEYHYLPINDAQDMFQKNMRRENTIKIDVYRDFPGKKETNIN